MTIDRRRAALRLMAISRESRGGLLGLTSSSSGFTQARIEASALIASCLGSQHYLVGKLEELSPVRAAFGSGLVGLGPADELCAYIDAAVALIDIGPGAPASSPSCDPDLWSYVGGLVEAEMWDKIPQAVVTFVEDWFRRHAGDPPNPKGGRLYGKGLFQELLKPGGNLALGRDASEKEGWRDLGTGLTKAIGNGHRHSITDRPDDLARFAWGVIGLGSLLIGEMKSTHPTT